MADLLEVPKASEFVTFAMFPQDFLLSMYTKICEVLTLRPQQVVIMATPTNIFANIIH